MESVPVELPEFFVAIDVLVGQDEPSNSAPSLDHGNDELPFNALGGPRFEILSYLLELEDADEDAVVTLIQAAGDKGRDVLVHQKGVLVRVIQCKNLRTKFGRSELLVELVKLLLFNEVKSFLPSSQLLYEVWAPRGLSEPASTLIAEWPNSLEFSDVLAAFQKVTATYKTLEHFRWDEVGERVLARLQSQFRLKQENGITLSRRVRQKLPVYQQFFQGIHVMQVPDVDLYLDKKLAPKVLEIMRQHGPAPNEPAGDATDKEIDEAAAYINSDRCDIAVSLLTRLDEMRGLDFTPRQRYRVEANLGAALFRLNQPERAAAHFLKAAPLEPNDERASTNEVFAHFLLGNDVKAHELAASRRTMFPNAGRLFSIWISSAPDGTEPSELQAEVPESLLEDPEVNVALARKFLRSGSAEEALRLARLAQIAAPDWAQCHLTVAHCAIAYNILPATIQTISFSERAQINDEGIFAAGRAIELATAKHDEHTEAQALAARCELFLFAGNVPAAVADAKRAFVLNPKDVSNVLTLGQTQLTENKLELGIATLEQAYELEARPDVALMLSRALRGRGKEDDLKRSIRLLEDLNLAQLPEGMRPPVAITFLQGLSLVRDWPRAERYLEEVRGSVDEATRQALSAFVLKGTEHLQDAEGRASEAIASLTLTTHPFTREFLARVLMTLGRFADALPLYEDLFRAGSSAFDPMQLIECAGRLNRDELVLEVFEELHRRQVVEWRLLEIELHYLHQYDASKAIERLNAYLDRNPGHKLARLQRSALAWEIGRNDLVESTLEELPAVGDLPVSYIKIALKLISLGPDKDQAVDYAYRFLKMHFDQAEAHDAMIFSVLGLPHNHEADPNLPCVSENAAVAFRELPDGAVRWSVLVKTDAPDTNFEERSIDDSVSQELLGKKVGDHFVLAPGIQDRVGEIVQILPKHVRRFQDCLKEMPVRFPEQSGNFQSVRMGSSDEIDVGMAVVFESVRRRAEHIKEIQELYRNQPIPIHLYAERFRTNAYEAMLHLAGAEHVQIKCSNGDAGVLEQAIRAFEDGKHIVLDLSAIATFRLIGIEDLLTPHRFVISHDSLVELRETLVNDLPDQKGGTMTFEDGRYSLYEEEEERKKGRLETDRAFFEKVREGTTLKPSLAVASVDSEQRATLFKFFGKYGFETIMLATHPDSVLLTDDLIQGDFATTTYGIRRGWTHAFLVYLRRINQISQERFIDATAKLIGMQYAFTPFNSSEMFACARLADYDPVAWPFVQMTKTFALRQNSFETLLRLAVGFFLLLQQLPVVPESAGRLLGALLEQMWSNADWRPLLLAIRRQSSRIFGLNVPAEAAFNAAFDTWHRTRRESLPKI